MGLERIAAVMQNVHSNYEIDLFVKLIKEAAKVTNCKDLNNPSLKVIADHIRSISFLIVDGVLPSNEGRGYVLRRIIRRAVRHGYKLGVNEAFLYKLVPCLALDMGNAYPELLSNQNNAIKVIKEEEQRFLETIVNGMEILNVTIKNLKADETNKVTELDGEVAFKLYDTYGFPLD